VKEKAGLFSSSIGNSYHKCTETQSVRLFYLH